MKRQSSRRSTPFRPTLEALSERVLPAVTVTNIIDPITLAAGLKIVGTNGNDHIDIHDSSSGGADVFVNGNQVIFGEFIEFFDIKLKDGKDQLHIEIDKYCGESKSFLIDTGAGNDVVEVFGSTFYRPDIENDTNVQFEIVDGGGRDSVDMTFDDIDSSYLAVITNLGSDNDSVNIEFIDRIVNASSVQLNLNLGRGNNVCDIDVLENVSESGIDILVTGGKNADLVELDLVEDFEAFANINYTANLGAGNDTFEAEVGDYFDVDLFCSVSINVNGGAGNDSLTVREDEDNEFTLRIDHVLDVHLDGGNGNDLITIDFQLDQGSFQGFGAVVAHVIGGNGDDTIDVTITNDFSAELVYDISILAGAGNDSVTFLGEDDSGLCFSYGVILDGGLGNQDSIDYGSSDFDLVIKNFEINAGPAPA